MLKRIVLALSLLLFCTPAIADPFVGKFVSEIHGESYYLTIRKSGSNAYNGALNTSKEESVFEGLVDGKEFIGCAIENGNLYCFKLTHDQDNRLVFQDQLGNSILFNRAEKSKSATASEAKKSKKLKKSSAKIAKGTRKVYINRVRLSDAKLGAYEAQYGTKIPDGRYWYDAICGAWGREGGATEGFIQPGLDLPKPIPANISGGGTGIFINGREIHIQEQQALQNLLGETYPGWYWLDANGNLGPIGQPALLNLIQVINQAQQAQSGTIAHGYDSLYGARGTLGAGGHYSGRTASGKSVEWFPGMSDMRFKKHIAPLTDPLYKINQLQGVSYRWRFEAYPDGHFPQSPELGLVAQDVEKVLPEVVNSDTDGIKSIDYYQLVPLLIEAIKEQQKSIEELRSIIANINDQQVNLNRPQ